MLKKYYLAYGSNLNLLQMKVRCPNAQVIGSVTLNDFRLCYKGDSDNFAYLTIEPAIGYSIPLGLFLIDKNDFKKLDRYEGYPYLYDKENVQINLKKEAIIYIMNDIFPYHLPSKEYINTCKQGYKDFDFDIQILDEALNYTKTQMSKNLKLK